MPDCLRPNSRSQDQRNRSPPARISTFRNRLPLHLHSSSCKPPLPFALLDFQVELVVVYWAPAASPSGFTPLASSCSRNQGTRGSGAVCTRITVETLEADHEIEM